MSINDPLLLALFLLIIALVLGRSYYKLKQKNKFILVQSQEIRKQLLELKEQSKQVQELYQEKQQVLSVVSHDLKGPFNRIFALVQLMNLTPENLTDDQKEYLGKIHQIVADGLGMMRNLLDARRLEEKGIDLMPESLNLTVLVGSLVKNSRALADKKKINLHFEGPAQAHATGDKLYLNRVFDNLLSNAIKFSPPGKSIYVQVTEVAEFIKVSIKDEGPGFSKEDMGNLYQKFQRLSARPTGGESSTGLGLSIVKSILDKIGGSVQCISEWGQGAEFIVSLPKTQLNK